MTARTARAASALVRAALVGAAASAAAGLVAVPAGGAPPAPPAASAGVKAECIDAHARSQRERQSGRLTAARAELQRCARAECPAPLREECVAWHGEVLVEQPQLSVEVRDHRGALVTDATLYAGEVALAQPLGEAAVPLDPGTHTLAVARPGGERVPLTVTLRAGQGRVVVVVRLPAPGGEGDPAATEGAPRATRAGDRTGGSASGAGRSDTTPGAGAGAAGVPGGGTPARADGGPGPVPAAASRPLPLAFWALAGTSAVALGTAGVFGWQGASAQRTLERCAPYCTPSQIDAMDRRYLVADVALGVAVLSAAGAALVAWFAPTAASASSAARGAAELGVWRF